MWSLLLVTLPTQPTAVRVRPWRALKALGCASLRDGAYLLPQAQEALFRPLTDDVRAHGGSATVLRLTPTDDAQRIELVALFDRSDTYAQWRAAADALQAELGALAETEARRRCRAVAKALQEIEAFDYYPGPAAEQAAAALAELQAALDARFSRGEPRARAAHDIAPLDRRKFNGKRWATRARPDHQAGAAVHQGDSHLHQRDRPGLSGRGNRPAGEHDLCAVGHPTNL